MAINAKGTKTINCGQIADLDSNNAFDTLTLHYLASAGDTIDIDVTDLSGMFARADKACQYSVDGGNTYIDFEDKNGEQEYLNVTAGLTTIKLKSTVDATTMVVLKG